MTPFAENPFEFIGLAAFAALLGLVGVWSIRRTHLTRGQWVETRKGPARKPFVYALGITFAFLGMLSGIAVIGTAFKVPAPPPIEEPLPPGVYLHNRNPSTGELPVRIIEGTVSKREITATSPSVHAIYVDDRGIAVSRELYLSAREGEFVRLAIGKKSIWRLN